MKNKIMLITYADSFGKNLKEMKEVIDRYFRREIHSIHILPFFPSSGDRGFAPINYREVDKAFGTWEDIKDIAGDYELMFDFMINHLSRRSPEFLDFVEKHDESEYADMFLRFCKFRPGGEPTEAEVDLLNKRKPCAPCEEITFRDGTTEKIWCTFDEEQMDLDLQNEAAWNYVESTLRFLMDQGLSQLRLDAFAFATKKVGTTCFFLEPEIWEMMDRIQRVLDEKGIPMLPEIHDHYTVQQFTILSCRSWCSILSFQAAAPDSGTGFPSVPEISRRRWIPMTGWEPWMSWIYSPRRSFRPWSVRLNSMGLILNGITAAEIAAKRWCIRLTAPTIQRWGNGMTATFFPGLFSFLHRGFLRFTIWGFWQGKMIMS